MCCGNAWKPIYFSKKDDGTTQPTTQYKKEITTSSTTEFKKEYQSLQQSSYVNQNIRSTTSTTKSTTTTRKMSTTTSSATLKYIEESKQSDPFTKLSYPSYSNGVKDVSTMATTTIAPISKTKEESALKDASFEETLPSYNLHGFDSLQEEQEIVYPFYGHYSYSHNYYYNFYDEFEEPLKTVQKDSIESLNNFEMYGKKTTKTISTTMASTVKVQGL